MNAIIVVDQLKIMGDQQKKLECFGVMKKHIVGIVHLK
jgi:hypothetical protein